MNLVVVVDREFRGEVENRLARVGRYHPSRLVHRRGRAGPHDDRRVGDASPPRTPCTGPATSRSGASASRSTSARSTSSALDTIVDPLLVAGPRDDGVGAARPHARRSTRCGGWRSIVLDRLAGRARGARRRSRAPPTCRARPTSSTSRGCARRRGASASPRRSTRRRCARALARDRRASTVRHRADSTAAGAAVLRLARVAPGLAPGARSARARRRARPATAARAAARSRSSSSRVEHGRARARRA